MESKNQHPNLPSDLHTQAVAHMLAEGHTLTCTHTHILQTLTHTCPHIKIHSHTDTHELTYSQRFYKTKDDKFFEDSTRRFFT